VTSLHRQATKIRPLHQLQGYSNLLLNNDKDNKTKISVIMTLDTPYSLFISHIGKPLLKRNKVHTIKIYSTLIKIKRGKLVLTVRDTDYSILPSFLF
jgi:hypothetical protein